MYPLKCMLLILVLVTFAGACRPGPSGPSNVTPGSSKTICGDDDREKGEICDRNDLDGRDCIALGYGAGVLACRLDCRDFDRRQCGAPASCGDNQRQGVELCDGSDLNGKSCEDLGYTAGVVSCFANCGDFDTSLCGPPAGCGDGSRAGVEACDGDDFGGLTCAHLGQSGGQLACSGDCRTVDASGCGGCTPTTCVAQGKNCGQIDDNCGSTLQCGSCTAPQTCGGSGLANVCGDESCTPNSCDSEGYDCGSYVDNCGNSRDCGTCTAPETCGGGGVSNVCGGECEPTTCSREGVLCGSLDDGCGETLHCGRCTPPETCGAVTAGICGCVAQSCTDLGKNCGIFLNNCGLTENCGSCSSGQTCGGGGVANVCGTGSCTPTSCAAQGKNCGSIPDGCGQVLFCGNCASPDICAGEGVENVCGPRSCNTRDDCFLGQRCIDSRCSPDPDSLLCSDCSELAGLLACQQPHACLINTRYDSNNADTAPASYCTPNCSDDEDCANGFNCVTMGGILASCAENETCANGETCVFRPGDTVGYCPCVNTSECSSAGEQTECEGGLCVTGRACGLQNSYFCGEVIP